MNERSETEKEKGKSRLSEGNWEDKVSANKVEVKNKTTRKQGQKQPRLLVIKIVSNNPRMGPNLKWRKREKCKMEKTHTSV